MALRSVLRQCFNRGSKALRELPMSIAEVRIHIFFEDDIGLHGIQYGSRFGSFGRKTGRIAKVHSRHSRRDAMAQIRTYEATRPIRC